VKTDPLLITVAPCIPPYMRQDFPGLDLSPEGVANEVVRAWNAGANVVHLHVWDAQGQPSNEVDAFQRTVDLIRQRCDIVIEGSTGGINNLSAAARSVALQAEIELASLNPGSVNYDQGVYVNSPEDIHYWASEMQRRGIKPDISIFEAGWIANAMELIEAGLFKPPYMFGFILGQVGAIPATPRNVLYLSETIPHGSVWGVIGHHGNDLWTSTMSMTMGGHARAGFEDNPYFRPGEPASSNAQLIERLVRIARELGREPASPTEARQLLGLKERKPA
jgi:3-keto-5-aminohexanoate cleavage enzyme